MEQKRRNVAACFQALVKVIKQKRPGISDKGAINTAAAHLTSQGIDLGRPNPQKAFWRQDVGTISKKCGAAVASYMSKTPGPKRPPKRPPRERPGTAQPDVDPANKALYDRAVAAIAKYIRDSVALYPIIQTNLAKKGMTTPGQVISKYFLPTMLDGIAKSETRVVDDKGTKRFFPRTTDNRILIALTQPTTCEGQPKRDPVTGQPCWAFRGHLLIALRTVEKNIDENGNEKYQRKWFPFSITRAKRVSHLYKMFTKGTPVAGYAPGSYDGNYDGGYGGGGLGIPGGVAIM